MRHRKTANRTPRAILSIGGALSLVAALTIAAQPAGAHRVTPPAVPGNLRVDAGSKPFFEGHAVGTQNYSCAPAGLGFAWTLFTPVATLFDARDQQVATHFFSPNPIEADTIRPAWQHSRDSSAVWGQTVDQSADAAYVAPDSIPWLLIRVVGMQFGPTGGATLTRATQIHRVNTLGGIAPATGCATATDVGKRAFVPYEADYFFYTIPSGK
jgi:hypothetical protein